MVDDILAPYENRRSPLALSEIAERRAGLLFGWQLNRLQGATPNATDGRLVDLYASGRISRQEYVSLVVKIASVEQSAKALA